MHESCMMHSEDVQCSNSGNFMSPSGPEDLAKETKKEVFFFPALQKNTISKNNSIINKKKTRKTGIL